MRKKNFKGRCEKRKLPKCEEVCRTYDAIQYAYAEVLSSSRDIKSFTPSREDIVFTSRLKEAGLLLNIPMVDHIIIGGDWYYSFKEQETL